MFAEDQAYDSRALKQHNNSNKHGYKSQHKIRQFLSQLDEQHNSEDEGIEDYKIGGYHPVHIGEVMINRYVVIQKLGWGHFSTVWLCKDFKYKTYVAVKIQKSSPNYMEAAFDEVQILQQVQKMCHSKQWQNKSRDDNHVVGLLNAFIHRTYYGNHFCMVFQILRCNLLDVIKRYNYEGVPIKICQQISKQILQGLDYLHRVCGIIHTDLKPENVMLCLSKQQLKQIVQQGQLSSHQLFAQRTKIFRQYLGFNSQKQEGTTNNGKIHEINHKLKNQKLSKNQKKNLRKKLKKQMSMSKEKQQKQQQGTNLENQSDNSQKDQQQKIKMNKTLQKKQKNLNIENIFDVHKGKIKINRGSKLRLPLKVKIADLGNACWKHHYFSTQIQTRQYRSPQVILGQTYNQTADIWSFACMMYQLLTGDLLFQPKTSKQYSKNHDHLAQMQQLLGPFDRSYILRSPKYRKYFYQDGKMKKFPSLNHYDLSTVLQLKNKIKPQYAAQFAEFLLPMLKPEPQKRIKALEALNLPWLKIKCFEQPIKMNQQDHQQLKTKFYENEAQFRSQIRCVQNYQASIQDLDDKVNRKQKLENSSKRMQKYTDIRYIDRSFTDLGYIGYCDGIDFQKLDKQSNWQFL